MAEIIHLYHAPFNQQLADKAITALVDLCNSAADLSHIPADILSNIKIMVDEKETAALTALRETVKSLLDDIYHIEDYMRAKRLMEEMVK